MTLLTLLSLGILQRAATLRNMQRYRRQWPTFWRNMLSYQRQWPTNFRNPQSNARGQKGQKGHMFSMIQ